MMIRQLGMLLRVRLKTTILVLVVVLVGIGGGGYVYALHQWHAAQQALQENRLDDARSSLRVCLFVWPRSVPVHILAARAARSKGNFEEAEAHLSRCLKLKPNDTDAAEVEFLLMRVQKGEEDQLAPLLMLYVDRGYAESALILETLSRAYLTHFRFGPAHYYLTRWIDLVPDARQAYRSRGWVNERLNDWEAALHDYQTAVDLDPNLVDIQVHIAELWLERSNTPEALKRLEPLYKQYPDRADIKARLGQCRFMEGLPEARPLLESALAELPDDPALIVCLARLEMQDNHLAEAESLLRRALKLDPLDTEVRFTLVACLQLQERWKDAEIALDQHRKDSAQMRKLVHIIQEEARQPSRDPAPAFEIGNVFLASNERVGLYWLHRALERNPRHVPTLEALADYYERKGDKDRAAQYRRRLGTEVKADKQSAARP
jgi:tetratricopeptide (TPR) repeat protein